LAKGAAISTAGLLVFHGGPTAASCLTAFGAGERRTVELVEGA
jgi:hypothetical protein